MAKYDDLKKKARDTLDTIADVSAEAYRVAEVKAKVFAKRAKLNAEISREKSIIRRSTIEIGMKYYELHKDAPEEALKELVEAVTQARSCIAEKREELENLKKNGLKCDCCDDDCCSEESAEEECCDDCCSEESADPPAEEKDE